MRPLPRLHAVTDAAIAARDEFGIKAAALASIGPAVGLHARLKGAAVNELVALTTRLLAHAGPPEASVFVNSRADVARALQAQGVQLGAEDLAPSDARRALAVGPPLWLGRSVHSLTEAQIALDEGADYLLLGHLFPTPSHADRPPIGIAALKQVVALGLPVIAIGGITAGRAVEVHAAGAWGVAAIRALWDAPDAGTAGLRMLAPWIGSGVET